MKTMDLDTLVLYAFLGIGVYWLVSRAMGTGVTVIPTDEPLRLVPDVPASITNIDMSNFPTTTLPVF
jgi:hypothetical protein